MKLSIIKIYKLFIDGISFLIKCMCKISVIVPCYNAANTIKMSLESLENQTFKDFEVIIIDDGSEDETLDIIRIYKKRKKMEINLIKQSHGGVSRARNKGLEAAKGKYIAFLDADDEYMAEFLEVLYSSIGDKDIAFCKYVFVKPKEKYQFNVGTLVKRWLDKNEMFNIFYHKRTEHVLFWGGLYRKDIIKQFEIVFPNEIKYGEDSQFLATYIYHCRNGGVYVENEMYKYVLQESSVTHNKTYEFTQHVQVCMNIVNLWKNDMQFSDYMGELLLARSIWSIAKDFAIENKQYFVRLQKEYDVRGAMQLMHKSGDEMSIRISAFSYLVSPNLFRWLVRRKK